MRRLFATASLAGAALFLACGGSASPRQPSDQIAFGVEMAREGLWSEAYFRFEQAARLGGENAAVYNNLAVAAEALGRFDEALSHYQKALRLDPGNRDLRSNYDRFSSFYESFRAREEGGEAGGEPEGGEGSQPEAADGAAEDEEDNR